MSADPRLPGGKAGGRRYHPGLRPGLTALPELQNLETMAHFCLQQARPAEIPAAFDLYCQTDRLNIWLRLAVHPMEYRHHLGPVLYQRSGCRLFPGMKARPLRERRGRN